MPGAFGTADESTLKLAARPGPSRAPTASTWSPPSPAPSPTRSAPAPAGWWPTTSASSGPSWPSWARSPPSRWCRPRPPAAEVLARRARRRVPVQRPGRPGRRGLRLGGHRRAARPGARLRHLPRATSCWPAPSAPPPSSCPFGHHGGNHPVRRLDTGTVEITSQNHNFSVADGTAPAASSHPRQPQRRHHRGPPLPRRARLQRAVPPRGRARAPRRPLPVRPVRRAHGERRKQPA